MNLSCFVLSLFIQSVSEYEDRLAQCDSNAHGLPTVVSAGLRSDVGRCPPLQGSKELVQVQLG